MKGQNATVTAKRCVQRPSKRKETNSVLRELLTLHLQKLEELKNDINNYSFKMKVLKQFENLSM